MKKLFAEKILDLGNIAVGALVFGYFFNNGFLPGKVVMILGMSLFLTAYILAYQLLKKGEK